MNKKRQKKTNKNPTCFSSFHKFYFFSFNLFELQFCWMWIFPINLFFRKKSIEFTDNERERVSIEMKLNWIVTWDSAQFWLLISWCEWCLPLCYCCCWCWSWCSGYHLNEIVCLSHGNAIITERRCQIFHGQCVLAIFIGLLLLIFRRCMRSGCIAGACFTML